MPTVNICAIDISHAFDRLNQNKLFLKLAERNAPPNFILILKCWYSKCFICVKWASSMSERVQITVGVKQGGVLSPYLFAVYVDNLLYKLQRSGLGCHIKSFCFNSVLYADDLLLKSISITDMNQMIEICRETLADIDFYK